MPTHHKRQHSSTRHHPRSTPRHHHRTDTDIADSDHSHNPADIEVKVIITHTEVFPDHIIHVITGALHDTITPALTIIAMTHHTRDYPHIEVP